MDLLTTKVVVMILMGFICLAIAVATWKINGCMKRKVPGKKETMTMSFLLCFGAGVLLATTLLHILPEAREMLEQQGETWEVEWLAELFLCIGFFVVYLIEEAVHKVLHHTRHKEEIHRTLSSRPQDCIEGEDGSSNQISQRSTSDLEQADSGCCDAVAECHNDMERQNIGSRRSSRDSDATKYNPKYEVRLSLSTNSMFPNYHPQDSVDVNIVSPPATPHHDKTANVKRELSDSHSHTVSETDSLMKDMITVMALSFHCVFEGIAIGVEEETGAVWTLFIAISIHKYVITFCLCVEILSSNTKDLFYFVYLVTFSIVSPIGIAIGILISEVGKGWESQDLVIGICQSLAAGTIIYVVMFEVLQREKERSVDGVLQLLALVIGFCVLMLMEIYVGEGEEGCGGHDDEHHHSLVTTTLSSILDTNGKNSTSNSSLVESLMDRAVQFVPLEDEGHDQEGHQHDQFVDPGYNLQLEQDLSH